MIAPSPTATFAVPEDQPDHPEPSDDELVAAVAEGDREAFNVISRRYWPILYDYALSRFSDHDDGEEVAQDSLLVAYQKISTGQVRPESLRRWLFGVVRTQCREQLAGLRRRRYAPLTDAAGAVCDCSDRVCARDELRRLLRRGLTPEQRERVRRFVKRRASGGVGSGPIPEEVRRWRERLNFTHRRAARALGTIHSTVQNWESGRSTPPDPDDLRARMNRIEREVDPLPRPRRWMLSDSPVAAGEVRAWRKRVGLSQREAARRLNVPVSTFSDWDRDRYQPTFDLVGLRSKMAEVEREICGPGGCAPFVRRELAKGGESRGVRRRN